MRSRLRFVWTAVLIVSVSTPRLSRGDQFNAPGAVVANLDGSFSYQAKFLKEGGPELLGSYGWAGITNVAGGFTADCFCESFCTVQPGAIITIQVDGQLTDPTQQGSADSWLSLCTPGKNYGTLTTVYPYGTTGVGGPEGQALLLWSAPNPAAIRTTLHWVLPQAGAVRLRLFDVAGRQVASLVDEMQSEGHHQIAWDARNAALGSGGGVYFARLTAAGSSLTRVIVLRP
jgi:hypothetical protein